MDALNKLSTVGIVIVYEYDDKPYLQLVTWDSHQQVRAKRSKYPAYDETCNQLISDDSICPRNPINQSIRINPNPYPILYPNFVGESVSIEDVFDKTYAIYPRKRAKQKADKPMLAT